ncbi:MAG: DNA cytosine methyltransferase [Thiotrichaceae bacterium]|nr:DNA cytosine methyltransferase [Thiotrichaceae bacterium]
MGKNKKAGVYIDLFSGCGGFSLGLGNAGWKGLFAVEKDAMAFDTFKHNLIDGVHRHFDWPEWLPQKATTIQSLLSKYPKELASLRGAIDLIAGGPPCQGFSMAGRRKSTDPRNKLSEQYLSMVDLIQPKYVVLENVRGFNSAFSSGGSKQAYSMIVKARLDKLGYDVYHDYVHCEQFGVPQARTRFLMLGIRRGQLTNAEVAPFEMLTKIRESFLLDKGLPNKPISVRQAISDLAITRKGAKVIHHSGTDGKGFKKLDYRRPPGKSNAYQKLMNRGLNGAQPNSLRLARHKPDTIKQFIKIKSNSRAGVVLSLSEKEALGIKKQAICVLHPDKPSKTLTTLPDDLLHYSEPRILTVRESARIQSFPDNFVFKGKYTTGGAMRTKECPRYTQVGNAVPPLLGEAIGSMIMKLAKSSK